MAAKTVRLSKDVLRVISTMEVVGCVAKITQGQLKRELYQDVNKVLDALGGKWDRRKGGHVFAESPVAALDGAIVTGEAARARDILGFFRTQPPMVRELIRLADVRPGMRVLEPEAGEGDIAKQILVACELVMVEIDPGRAAKLRDKGSSLSGAVVYNDDFLRTTPALLGGPFDRIIMNPPFAMQQDVAHVTHAFGFLKPGGRLVSVMSAGIGYRDDKKAQAFRALVESVEGEFTDNEPLAFRASGTDIDTVTLVMDRP